MATSHALPLLNLPGELRNRIYRLSLPETIDVNTSTFPEPPLLLTCKMIRQEASEIFYNESRIHIYLPSRDSTHYMALISKIPTFKALGVVPITPVIHATGSPDWANFLEYLRRKHAVEPSTFRIAPKANERLARTVAEGELQALCTMVKDLYEVPWLTVQRAVQRFQRTLIACDPRWAAD